MSLRKNLPVPKISPGIVKSSSKKTDSVTNIAPPKVEPIKSAGVKPIKIVPKMIKLQPQIQKTKIEAVKAEKREKRARLAVAIKDFISLSLELAKNDRVRIAVEQFRKDFKEKVGKLRTQVLSFSEKQDLTLKEQYLYLKLTVYESYYNRIIVSTSGSPQFKQTAGEIQRLREIVPKNEEEKKEIEQEIERLGVKLQSIINEQYLKMVPLLTDRKIISSIREMAKNDTKGKKFSKLNTILDRVSIEFNNEVAFESIIFAFNSLDTTALQRQLERKEELVQREKKLLSESREQRKLELENEIREKKKKIDELTNQIKDKSDKVVLEKISTEESIKRVLEAKKELETKKEQLKKIQEERENNFKQIQLLKDALAGKSVSVQISKEKVEKEIKTLESLNESLVQIAAGIESDDKRLEDVISQVFTNDELQDVAKETILGQQISIIQYKKDVETLEQQKVKLQEQIEVLNKEKEKKGDELKFMFVNKQFEDITNRIKQGIDKRDPQVQQSIQSAIKNLTGLEVDLQVMLSEHSIQFEVYEEEFEILKTKISEDGFILKEGQVVKNGTELPTKEEAEKIKKYQDSLVQKENQMKEERVKISQITSKLDALKNDAITSLLSVKDYVADLEKSYQETFERLEEIKDISEDIGNQKAVLDAQQDDLLTVASKMSYGDKKYFQYGGIDMTLKLVQTFLPVQLAVTKFLLNNFESYLIKLSGLGLVSSNGVKYFSNFDKLETLFTKWESESGQVTEGRLFWTEFMRIHLERWFAIWRIQDEVFMKAIQPKDEEERVRTLYYYKRFMLFYRLACLTRIDNSKYKNLNTIKQHIQGIVDLSNNIYIDQIRKIAADGTFVDVVSKENAKKLREYFNLELQGTFESCHAAYDSIIIQRNVKFDNPEIQLVKDVLDKSFQTAAFNIYNYHLNGWKCKNPFLKNEISFSPSDLGESTFSLRENFTNMFVWTKSFLGSKKVVESKDKFVTDFIPSSVEITSYINEIMLNPRKNQILWNNQSRQLNCQLFDFDEDYLISERKSDLANDLYHLK